MMKLAVLACLLVVSYAQEPPKPELPETFVSEFEVFRKRGGDEERGQGKWDRSTTMKSFVNMAMYKAPQGNVTMFFEHLGLFESHMEYNVFTDREGKKTCDKHQIPESDTFPVIWDWLKDAHFHKFEDPRTNKSYDAWTARAHEDEERTLIIDPAMPTKPAALMTRSREEIEDMRFKMFEAEAPPSTSFTIPTECMTPPPHKTRPQRHH